MLYFYAHLLYCFMCSLMASRINRGSSEEDGNEPTGNRIRYSARFTETFVESQTDKQTDGRTTKTDKDRQIDDRQTYIQTDTQTTDILTDRQKTRQTDRVNRQILKRSWLVFVLLRFVIIEIRRKFGSNNNEHIWKTLATTWRRISQKNKNKKKKRKKKRHNF